MQIPECERRSKSALFCRHLSGRRRLTAAADFPERSETGAVTERVSAAAKWGDETDLDDLSGSGIQGGRGAGDDSRVIGAVIDIPALIAWAERAASRRRSVKPASRQRRWPEGPGFTDR
jgi:hypothetical protein